jgi:hypothetical protein
MEVDFSVAVAAAEARTSVAHSTQRQVDARIDTTAPKKKHRDVQRQQLSAAMVKELRRLRFATNIEVY